MNTCTAVSQGYSNQPCLPHTGLDLGPFAVLGLVLVVIGVALRRLT